MVYFKYNRQKWRFAVLITSIFLSWTAVSNAETCDSTQTFNLATTDWNLVMTLMLFDQSLGDLQSITFSLSGDVQGNAAYENEDAQSQVIDLNLSAEIVAKAPVGLIGFTTLAVINPLANVSETAASYDGVRDFAGTSGNTFVGLTNTDSIDAFYDNKNPLFELLMKPFFTTGTPGTTVDIPIEASGESTGSGSGNLSTNFSTNASAQLTVTYTYDLAPVPEPSSFLVLLVGVATFSLKRRR